MLADAIASIWLQVMKDETRMLTCAPQIVWLMELQHHGMMIMQCDVLVGIEPNPMLHDDHTV